MKQPPTILYDNARIITRTECVEGSLLVEERNIAALGETTQHADCIVDCEGDLLIPGLVELHTDNLEMNIQPRPGVIWPFHNRRGMCPRRPGGGGGHNHRL
jgi:alpha-D-ribose 1-methylphosphonate 5-triphosphate diphosphatase